MAVEPSSSIYLTFPCPALAVYHQSLQIRSVGQLQLILLLESEPLKSITGLVIMLFTINPAHVLFSAGSSFQQLS